MWKPDPSQIVTPEIIREEKRATMRALRNRLLDESDWSQIPDAPNADKALWRTYRQALRDLDMDIPVWPEKPPG